MTGDFIPGDVVRLDVTDDELRSLDDDSDGVVEAVVLNVESAEAEVTVAVLSGHDRSITGHLGIRCQSRYTAIVENSLSEWVFWGVALNET